MRVRVWAQGLGVGDHQDTSRTSARVSYALRSTGERAAAGGSVRSAHRAPALSRVMPRRLRVACSAAAARKTSLTSVIASPFVSQDGSGNGAGRPSTARGCVKVRALQWGSMNAPSFLFFSFFSLPFFPLKKTSDDFCPVSRAVQLFEQTH